MLSWRRQTATMTPLPACVSSPDAWAHPLRVALPGRRTLSGRQLRPSFALLQSLGGFGMTQMHHINDSSAASAGSDAEPAEVVVYFGDDPLRVYQLRQWL